MAWTKEKRHQYAEHGLVQKKNSFDAAHTPRYSIGSCLNMTHDLAKSILLILLNATIRAFWYN